MNKKITGILALAAMLITLTLFPAISHAATASFQCIDDAYTDSTLTAPAAYTFSQRLAYRDVADKYCVDRVGLTAGGVTEQSALRFDLYQAVQGNITSAKLTFYVTDLSGSPILNVIPTTDDSWSPSSATFPSFDPANDIGGGRAVSGTGWVTLDSLDVTSYINSLIDAGSFYADFVLAPKDTSPAGDELAFYSWINTIDRSLTPQLIIEYTPDDTAPAGYSVSIDQANINASNKNNPISFTFSGAETDTKYSYSLSSSGGGTPVTGSGTVTSATQQVSGIDVSGLPDGTLTLSVTLKDRPGNTGTAVTDTIAKDTALPSGYSVSIDQANISSSNKNAMSFTFSGAETGTTCNYTVSSSGGGTPVTGSGSVSSATQAFSGIDVSGLPDGTLTLSAALTDAAGNAGSAATATVTKDTVTINAPTVTGPAATNDTTPTWSWTTGGNGNGTFRYKLDDSDLSTGATETADTTFTPPSALAQGTYTLYVQESNGSSWSPTGSKAITVDTVAPSGYTVAPGQIRINLSNYTAMSFSLSGAETGTTCNYTVSSSGGGTPVTGSGQVSSATQTVSGINGSGLHDGTLTISVTLTDAAGNTGGAATATVAKDATAPSGYSVYFDKAYVDAANQNAIELRISGAELGTTYSYQIGLSNVVSFVGITSTSFTIDTMNLSGQPDGTVTVAVKLTDSFGNTGNAAYASITKDATGPSGYSVSIGQANINPSNKTAMSFSLSGAEVGAAYSYSIHSSGGGTPIAADGVVTSASQAFSGIDVSSLPDGVLTLTATLLDSYGNAGNPATATVTKDTAVPSGYNVSFGQTHINAANQSAVSFAFSGAEVGTTYNYTISSSSGGTPLTGNGTITSASQTFSGLDASGLADGTLTISATLTDTLGTGSAATATILKDTVSPSGYTASIGQAHINLANKTALSFSLLGAEVGTTYNYSITSSGGGTPKTGSGTASSAAQTVSRIDVSGLPDGTLTLSVTLTDGAGNAGGAATATVPKDTLAPAGYTAQFDQSAVNQSNKNALSFTFSGAETGAMYTYTISGSGGTPLTGSGTITSASQTVSGLDVSGLPDGTLTLVTTLTDSAGNTGSVLTATVPKETSAPVGYSMHTSMPEVNSSNKRSLQFSLSGAEVGASYVYTISSSGGGLPGMAFGTVASASQKFSGIDVSGLPDGTLTISVTLTDSYGNTGSPATVTISKDTVSPVYVLTITAGDGGSVSDGGSYTAGCAIPILATAQDGYRFDHWSVSSGTLGSSSSASTTYTMPAGQATVTANFVLSRWQQTLTDNSNGSGASVSGVIDEGATIAVGQMSLGSDPAAAAIGQMQANSGFTMAFGQDISIQGGTFTGSLTVTIPVGTQYNGQTATVLHDAHGTLETFTVTVAGGNVTVTVTSLSPFAVFLPVSNASGSVSIAAGATQLYVGGRTVLTPSVSGGAWQYDKSMVSLKQNADGTYTVTALKSGTASLHYTVGWASADVALTIGERAMPQTGQDFMPVYILLILAGCAVAGAVIYKIKMRN